MASKEYNKKYYRENRKYILLKKKLQKQGKPVPPITEIHKENGQILIVAGDVIISVITPHSATSIV